MNERPALSAYVQTARNLLGDDRLDCRATLAFLNTVPDALFAGSPDIVRHAHAAVSAAPGGDHRHEAVARYMLARVVIALETAQTPSLAGPGALDRTEGPASVQSEQGFRLEIGGPAEPDG